jgi:hypothetical protein
MNVTTIECPVCEGLSRPERHIQGIPFCATCESSGELTGKFLRSIIRAPTGEPGDKVAHAPKFGPDEPLAGWTKAWQAYYWLVGYMGGLGDEAPLDHEHLGGLFEAVDHVSGGNG